MAGGERADFACRDLCLSTCDAAKQCMNTAPEHIDQRRACAFVRHVDELRAGRRNKQFDAQMAHRPGTRRSNVDFARLSLGQIDQLIEGFRCHRRMHHQQLRHVSR